MKSTNKKSNLLREVDIIKDRDYILSELKKAKMKKVILLKILIILI